MKIKILDRVKDVDVMTITIVEQYGGYKMWNCPTCRNPVFQYRGRVISLINGEVPTEVPVIIQCSNSNCRQKYLIKTMVTRDLGVL